MLKYDEKYGSQERLDEQNIPLYQLPDIWFIDDEKTGLTVGKASNEEQADKIIKTMLWPNKLVKRRYNPDYEEFEQLCQDARDMNRWQHGHGAPAEPFFLGLKLQGEFIELEQKNSEIQEKTMITPRLTPRVIIRRRQSCQ